MATLAAAAAGSSTTRLRERLRRNWLVLAFLVVVMVAVVRWADHTASGEWSTSLDERLTSAGAGTNAVVLDAERQHLEALRAFSFATGVPEALSTLDVASIERILTPVDANLSIPMVDILDESGRVVFAFRAEGQPSPIYRDRGPVGIVASALAGEPDALGERFSTLLVTDEGPLLATAGPVRLDSKVVGAVLVMTPIEEVLAESTTTHGELLTVYTAAGGMPLATTAPVKPRTLPKDLANLLPAESLPVRSSYEVPDGQVREQLGALIVRHQPVAWLGVAELDTSGRLGGQIIVIFVLGLLAVAVLVVVVSVLWRRDGDGGGGPDDDDDDVFAVAELPTPSSARQTVQQGGRSRW
jgi:hypothetical protein